LPPSAAAEGDVLKKWEIEFLNDEGQWRGSGRPSSDERAVREIFGYMLNAEWIGPDRVRLIEYTGRVVEGLGKDIHGE
jgi:hypothetical protein